MLPGPASPCTQDWVNLPSTATTAGDVGAWPYSVGLLVSWVTFLGTLHWPAVGADLGVGGVSFVEMFFQYELWAGERLVLEKAVPKCRRPGRPTSVSAVPFGLGIDIWSFGTLHGVLLLSWKALFHFGTVRGGLQGGSPLGASC